MSDLSPKKKKLIGAVVIGGFENLSSMALHALGNIDKKHTIILASEPSEKKDSIELNEIAQLRKAEPYPIKAIPTNKHAQPQKDGKQCRRERRAAERRNKK